MTFHATTKKYFVSNDRLDLKINQFANLSLSELNSEYITVTRRVPHVSNTMALATLRRSINSGKHQARSLARK